MVAGPARLYSLSPLLVFVKAQITGRLAQHLTRTRVDSDCSVHAHYEVEHILHRLEQVLPIVDVDVEFALHRIVNQNARLDVILLRLVVPVSLESDWDSMMAFFPSSCSEEHLLSKVVIL